MFHYAISDTHGFQDAFDQALSVVDLTDENHLYLLGDYVPRQNNKMSEGRHLQRCAESLSFVRRYQHEHEGHVTVLPGNHELFLLDRVEYGEIQISDALYDWLRRIPRYVETDSNIFVHAGVDEEAGECWRWGTSDWDLCGKFPATFGRFCKTIVAGHVGAWTLAGDPDYEGVFWDGQSHYYIDGSTQKTGRVNVLRYDVDRNVYEQLVATAQGVGTWHAIEPALGLVGKNDEGSGA